MYMFCPNFLFLQEMCQSSDELITVLMGPLKEIKPIFRTKIVLHCDISFP